MEHLDNLRKFLKLEPRGHHGMYGCIITPPVSPHADFGVLFLHNEGWSTMCGHGIVGMITVDIETGRFKVTQENQKFIIDSPAGEVVAYAKCQGSVDESVSFENVSSFGLKKDLPIELEGQKSALDVAFGVAFYVVISSKSLGLTFNNKDLPAI